MRWSRMRRRGKEEETFKNQIESNQGNRVKSPGTSTMASMRRTKEVYHTKNCCQSNPFDDIMGTYRTVRMTIISSARSTSSSIHNHLATICVCYYVRIV